METIKITFELCKDDVISALQLAARYAHMKYEKEPDWEEFVKDMVDDVKDYLLLDLPQFFYDSIANDGVYIKYLKEPEE